MKLVKSLLLGSAAGLTVVAGAHAADLPVKKAAPVEYVRVCSTHGAGFFYIPGTDTCIRVSGRARFQATYLQAYTRSGDLTGYQGLGRLNLDARTATGYGTLRAFVRFDMSYGTGPFLASGTARLAGIGFTGQGIDTFNRSLTAVNVDKAFIQFAGFTAGRAASFFDFYAHDLEFIGSSLGSDLASTNLLAYTATFGQGFSATLSMEDPLLRKSPIFGSATAGSNFAQFQVFTANGNFSPVLGTNAFGQPIIADYDVVQRQRMPDFVGALRYDAAWGSAQVSAAVHEINTSNAINTATTSNVRGINGSSTVGAVAPRPRTEYGWAVQGGVKINLPFIAAGDLLYLQGSYGEGALRYTGYSAWLGGYTNFASLATGTTFGTSLVDAVVDPISGRLDLSKSWTVSAAYLHYWAPEWRSAVFGSYGEVSYGKGSRANLGFVNQLGGFSTSTLPSPNAPGFGFSSQIRDTNQIIAGASLIWSPVRDLDIGIEGNYARLAVQSGRVIDQNKAPGFGGQSVAAVVNGQPVAAGGGVLPTTNATDTFQIRMRVQRDF